MVLDHSFNLASHNNTRLQHSTQTSHDAYPRQSDQRHLPNFSNHPSSFQGVARKGRESPHIHRGKVSQAWKTSSYSNGAATSFNWRSGRPMAGMLELERSRTRRERTFIGSECAVCEEPLEHTLRGERVLQFSCGHVSHEACFYEYIKEFESQYCPTCNAPLGLDTSRGGNVLDLGTVTVAIPYILRKLTAQQRNLLKSSGK